MRLSRPRTRTVKVSIQDYLGSQRYMKSTTISVYETTGAEVAQIIREALKARAMEEVVEPRVTYNRVTFWKTKED